MLTGMQTRSFPPPYPAAAEPAIHVIERLSDAGHRALLAGGCVRDLLRGAEPHDYDVATSATPAQVQQLFPRSRAVGAQFGVILVRQRGVWVEVATFRSDGDYSDGRRPDTVTFADPDADAQRRDFTVNGMFLDPLAGEIIDYVDGLRDLDAKQVRAIGEPQRRFAEDYLRLLRAVRFSARLGFPIEPATRAAVIERAANLRDVAAERVREELERMLAHASRGEALRELRALTLIEHLWSTATWDTATLDRAEVELEALGSDPSASTEHAALPLAIMLQDRTPGAINDIARTLTCSNDQRDAIRWLVTQRTALLDVDQLSLAEFKRLRAAAHFDALAAWTRVQLANITGGDICRAALDRRAASLTREAAAPAPLITGDDLQAFGAAPGPHFKRILDTLYTEQLNEVLDDRTAAEKRARDLLADESNMA